MSSSIQPDASGRSCRRRSRTARRACSPRPTGTSRGAGRRAAGHRAAPPLPRRAGRCGPGRCRSPGRPSPPSTRRRPGTPGRRRARSGAARRRGPRARRRRPREAPQATARTRPALPAHPGERRVERRSGGVQLAGEELHATEHRQRVGDTTAVAGALAQVACLGQRVRGARVVGGVAADRTEDRADPPPLGGIGRRGPEPARTRPRPARSGPGGTRRSRARGRPRPRRSPARGARRPRASRAARSPPPRRVPGRRGRAPTRAPAGRPPRARGRPPTARRRPRRAGTAAPLSAPATIAASPASSCARAAARPPTGPAVGAAVIVRAAPATAGLGSIPSSAGTARCSGRPAGIRRSRRLPWRGCG